MKSYAHRSPARRRLVTLAAALFVLMVPLIATAEDFIRTGVYTGNDGASFSYTGLGFQPDLLIIKSGNPRHTIIKTSDMPNGLSKKLSDNRALENDRILTLDADGFTVGNHDEVNKGAEEYYWVAMKNVPGQVDIGQYVGNGQVNREVSMPGIFPDAALIIPREADFPVYRTTEMGFWEAYRLDGTGQEFNSIGWFNTDAIYVGTDHTVNEWNQDYYYIAWQGAPEAIELGFYIGNDQPSQDILGLNQNPKYLILTSSSGTHPPVHRPDQLTGDATLFFPDLGIQSNLIQAMWDGGFQVGSDPSVNLGGESYYWLAFANPGLQTDLQVSLNFDDTTPNEGQTLNFTVEVTNLGPESATGVEVSYLLPAGLTYGVGNADQGSYNNVTGIWDVGNVAFGDTHVLSISATVDAGTGGSSITNTAAVTAFDQSDPDLSNNSASQDLSVLAALGADLEISVAVDNATPGVGESIQFTVTLTNHGPDPATGIGVNAYLTPDMTYESSIPSEGLYNGGSGWWGGIDLGVGEIATLLIVGNPKNNTAGTTIIMAPAISGLDQVDPNSANDSASVDIYVVPVDLQVTKLVNLATPDENALITYTVVVSNVNDGAATGVIVSDYWPAGLTFVSASATTGSYDDGTGEWTVGNLDPSQTEVLNISGTVDSGTAGNTITNEVEITSMDQDDFSIPNNNASVDITVAMPGDLDLNLNKTIDNSSPNAGDNVVYTVTVANPGPDTATGIAITDLLPAETIFVSAMTNKGSYDDGTGLWNVGDLDAGFQAVLDITVLVEAAAIGVTVTNSASITALDQLDPDLSNNTGSADFTVPTSDLQMSKTVNNATPGMGDTVTYTVNVFNNGPNQGTDIQVNDLLPAEVSFVSATPDQGTYDEITGTWDVGNLNPALEATLTIDVTVDLEAAGSTVSNTASVAAVDQADPVAANDSATADITVAGADLALGLVSDVATPFEGGTVVFTLTVQNTGPNDATGIAATQLLPAGLTYQSDTPSQGSYVDGSGLWTVGDLANGASATLDITATVDAGTLGDVITNPAAITAGNPADPNPANDTDSVDITVIASGDVDLQLTKTVDNGTPGVGDTVIYTVTLSNPSVTDATGITVTDLLPAEVTFVSAITNKGSYDDGTGLWTVGDLDASYQAELTITAIVEPAALGATITNTASITALDQVDPAPANDTATADITAAGADLALGLVSDVATALEGETVVFTLTVQNTGPDDATGIAATQLLPAGLTYQSDTPSQGSYVDGSGLWTVGDLANGASATLDITATVDAGTLGDVITNPAAITAGDPADGNPANDTDSVDITVIASGDVDLQLTKTVDNGTPGVGDDVIYTVTLANPSVTDATGITVTDLLPAEVTFVSAITNKGSYDDGTGLWAVGDLDASYQAELTITAIVEPAALGATITNTASITALDQVDPAPANDTASADFTVPASDLQMSKTVNSPTPEVGDTVVYTVKVFNDGPDIASGILVSDMLPAGLSFVSASADQGSYDHLTGVWDVGGLNPALEATLTIDVTVELEAAGQTVSNNAFVTGADQADPNTGNNSAMADFTVPGADLALSLVSDTLVAGEGTEVTFTLTIQNNGPDEAPAIGATQAIPSGLTYQSAIPSQGSYNQVSGLWTVGNLTNTAGATLDLTVTIDSGTAGSVIANVAAITTSGLPDPDPDNNTATASITVPVEMPSDGNILWPLVGAPAEVWPGETRQVEILTFSFVNNSTQPDTLQFMQLSNMTPGTGTPDQMDAEWQPLAALNYLGELTTDTDLSTPVSSTFVGGLASFDDLQWAVPAGDTLNVTILGSASLQARDGAQLRASIHAAEDLVFNQEFDLVGTWPLVSGQVLDVNGFVAAQAEIIPRPTELSDLLSIGSELNLALTVDLPGDGYLDDTLYSLSLKNNGTAQPGTDITRIQAWADGGNGTFDFGGGDDTLLGPATYSGERWQLTGLGVPVPADGRRFFVTVDIAETARDDVTIRLSLPAGNGFAVEMFSDNDGPVDESLESPNTLGISVTDRIILTAEWFLAGMAFPGTNDLPLLQFVLTNTYADPYPLQSLTFTNSSLADGANSFQRDALCRQVDLRQDTNNNGELDATDLTLASGFVFFDGKVTFSGLPVILESETATRLFVTADLGLMTVADGNHIKGEIESLADVGIPGATIVSSWPLHSGVDWLVNGMTSQQITTEDISVLTLGPGEGPILAMDLTIPSNGYASDELSGITFANDGSADSGDIQLAELWEDGGNGTFDAGGGDDFLLGPLTLIHESWTSTVLARPIPVGGLRLFTSLTVADAPQDSVTVKLGVPTGGITVSSGNDGPLDEPIIGNSTLVISTSPLRTAVTFATAATDTGQTGAINMSVRNAGSETVADIVPDLNFVNGAGLLVYGDPTPSVITSLDPGQETQITWSFHSVSPGEVVMEGNVHGLVNGDQVRRSIVTPTAVHRIFTPVPRLDLYPTANLPFSINRGQQGLVPLTLTFVNPGDANVADAQLTSIRMRLMETEDGPDIVPADLLDRVIVSEGTNVYLSTTILPTSGSEVDLVFSHPVVVTGSEPVTLGLRLDLRLNSTVPSFLVSIENATWLEGNDAINGADLDIVMGEGTFPVRTGQANLVAPAAGLDVAVNLLDPGFTVPGQTNVLLTEISLFQSASDDNSSTIDVGRLAFKFHDTNGDPLADPALWLSRLSLQSAFQEHFSGVPVIEADSLVVLQLSAPVTISGSATLVLRLMGDIAEDSPLGRITPLIGSADFFDARDGNMNNPVPVTLTTDPAGPELSILGPATVLTASGIGSMPVQVSQGTRDLTALNLNLTNPGGPDTSPAMCDTLVLEFFDAARQPLAPDLYLDRIRILQDEEMLGFIIDPSAADGIVTLPLTGLQIEAGNSAELRVSLDLKPDSPTGSLEVTVDATGIQAADAVTGTPLVIQAASGTSWPLSSGVGFIVVPADELAVGAASLMPPMLAPQNEGYPVLSLELANPAGEGSGGIEINALVLRQEDALAANPDLGRMLASANLMLGDDIVATASDLTPTATSFTLVPVLPLIIQAEQTINLQVEVVLASDAPSGVLELGLHNMGVQAGPPGGEGLEIRVLPASGQTFPFITEKGNIGGASLAESYINFPNPFAAGQESTTFAFNLPQDGRVNLRLVTPHGELVAEILQDETRPAGFYQGDLWSGLNGNGVAVRNGVYVAELVVEFSDGSRERILRKVAVVR